MNGNRDFAAVAGAGVAHRAGGRRPEERPVVGLAVVVAGEPEAERDRQDQQRRRERPPVADDAPRGVLAVRGEARRVERRQVRVGVVVGVDQRPPTSRTRRRRPARRPVTSGGSHHASVAACRWRSLTVTFTAVIGHSNWDSGSSDRGCEAGGGGSCARTRSSAAAPRPRPRGGSARPARTTSSPRGTPRRRRCAPSAGAATPRARRSQMIPV